MQRKNGIDQLQRANPGQSVATWQNEWLRDTKSTE